MESKIGCIQQKINAKVATKKEGSFIGPAVIQRKLTVGSSNDSYEIEADRVADRVVSMNGSHHENGQTGSLTQRDAVTKSITPLVQKKETHAGDGQASSALTQQINSNKGGGHKMDSNTQSFMESRFGADFSQVSIHTGTQAAQMSSELNAQAFTVGNDIYFNEGMYSPNSTSGKHLLAHELTHTIQQKGIQRKIQRTVTKDKKCAVHAYDNSSGTDKAVIPQKSGTFPYQIGVSSVDNMVTKVNEYINSKDNSCKCVSRLEIRGHGTDGYQSVGNGTKYVNDDKALVYNSKQSHLEKLKTIKFCNSGMLLLTGCHTGRGKGKDLLKKVSNILPGILIGGAQHYTHGTGLGGVKVVGEGDEVTSDFKVKDTSKSKDFMTSPYVNWHLTIDGKEYTITGKDITGATGQSKLKSASKVKVITPEGETIKVK